MLIGLNGVAVKAHGSSDSGAFANSIKIAIQKVQLCLKNIMQEYLEVI